MKLRLQGFVPELSAIQTGLRINHSYLHLLDLHPWSFLKAEYLFATVAPYTTGTIDVTLDSTTVTGTSTVWVSGMADRFLRTSTNTPFYKISSVNTVAQTLTLEQAYTDTTATDQAYTIFQHQFDYPTDCKNIINVRYQHKLPQRTKQFIDSIDPDRRSTGQPNFWIPLADSTFELWPVPNQVYTMRIHYNRSISELSTESATAELSENLIIAHAILACYRQLASRPEGQGYLNLIPSALRDFQEFWTTAVEEDMRKLSLPTRVRTPDLYDFPQDNDYWLSHDPMDPRGIW